MEVILRVLFLLKTLTQMFRTMAQKTVTKSTMCSLYRPAQQNT